MTTVRLKGLVESKNESPLRFEARKALQEYVEKADTGSKCKTNDPARYSAYYRLLDSLDESKDDNTVVLDFLCAQAYVFVCGDFGWFKSGANNFLIEIKKFLDKWKPRVSEVKSTEKKSSDRGEGKREVKPQQLQTAASGDCKRMSAPATKNASSRLVALPAPVQRKIYGEFLDSTSLIQLQTTNKEYALADDFWQFRFKLKFPFGSQADICRLLDLRAVLPDTSVTLRHLPPPAFKFRKLQESKTSQKFKELKTWKQCFIAMNRERQLAKLHDSSPWKYLFGLLSECPGAMDFQDFMRSENFQMKTTKDFFAWLNGCFKNKEVREEFARVFTSLRIDDPSQSLEKQFKDFARLEAVDFSKLKKKLHSKDGNKDADVRWCEKLEEQVLRNFLIPCVIRFAPLSAVIAILDFGVELPAADIRFSFIEIIKYSTEFNRVDVIRFLTTYQRQQLKMYAAGTEAAELSMIVVVRANQQNDMAEDLVRLYSERYDDLDTNLISQGEMNPLVYRRLLPASCHAEAFRKQILSGEILAMHELLKQAPQLIQAPVGEVDRLGLFISYAAMQQKLRFREEISLMFKYLVARGALTVDFTQTEALLNHLESYAEKNKDGSDNKAVRSLIEVCKQDALAEAALRSARRPG